MKLVCNILYLEMTMIAHRIILKLYGQFAFTFVESHILAQLLYKCQTSLLHKELKGTPVLLVKLYLRLHKILLEV